MAYRAICDRCGSKKWNHELRKEWNGLRVCRYECFEVRHPQDRVRGRVDDQTLPWVRPEPTDVYVWGFLLREDGSPYFREDGNGGIVREEYTGVTHDP
jgi:hypothetical protein